MVAVSGLSTAVPRVNMDTVCPTRAAPHGAHGTATAQPHREPKLELQPCLHGMSPEGDQNQPQILGTQPCHGGKQQGEQAGGHSVGLELADGMQGRVG